MTKLIKQENNNYTFNHNCRIISVKASSILRAERKLCKQLRRNN